MNVRSFSALGASALVMAGCGAHLRVDHVDPSAFSAPMNEPGMYFALPKTVIQVEVPVILSTKVGGGYGWGKSAYLKQCNTQPQPAKVSRTREKDVVTARLGAPVVTTTAVADREHLYRLDVDMETFSSFAHTLTLNEEGILVSADSRLDNPAAEIALEVLKLAASAAGGGAKGGGADLSCADLIAHAATLQAFADQLEIDLSPVKRERKNYLLNQSADTEAAVVDKVLAMFDAEENARKAALVAQLGASYRDAVNAFARESKTEAFTLSASITPAEFAPARIASDGWRVTRNAEPTDEELKVAQREWMTLTDVPADVKAGDFATRLGLMFNLAPEVSVCAAVAAGEPCAPTVDDGPLGFRYRIPTKGTFALGVNSNNGPTDWAKGHVAVAQYGPLVVLPAKVGGTKGEITLNLNAATGGASSISVGATPLPTGKIDAFGSTLVGYRDARDARRKAAEEAAASEELDALNAENTLLDARKKNRELREALGL